MGGWDRVKRCLRTGSYLDERSRRCESPFPPFTWIGNIGYAVWGEKMFFTWVLSAWKVKCKFLSIAFKVRPDPAPNYFQLHHTSIAFPNQITKSYLFRLCICFSKPLPPSSVSGAFEITTGETDIGTSTVMYRITTFLSTTCTMVVS